VRRTARGPIQGDGREGPLTQGRPPAQGEAQGSVRLRRSRRPRGGPDGSAWQRGECALLQPANGLSPSAWYDDL